MTIHHRKSAGLAIDGKPQDYQPNPHGSALDIDDINIWLLNYLQEHGARGVTVEAGMTLAQLGFDAAACRTLLAAFEYRYSVAIAKPDAGSFGSVHACAAFLLAQINAAAPGDKETTAYVGMRHMVRTLISKR